MMIHIHGKHMTVTDALHAYVEEKLGRLNRYFDPLNELTAHVTLSMEREQQRVEATITMHGILFRAEENADDMYAAIDFVSDKLQHQITKYKEKLNQRCRDRGLVTRGCEVNEAIIHVEVEC